MVKKNLDQESKKLIEDTFYNQFQFRKSTSLKHSRKELLTCELDKIKVIEEFNNI